MANNGKNNNVIRIPTKRVINLALLGKKHVNVIALVITIVVVVAIVGVFAKFAVIDRLLDLSAAQKEAEEVQRELQAGYNTIATDYPDIEDKYAHYSTIEMTDKELERVDRTKVIEIIKNNISDTYSNVTIDKWSVQENVLKIEITTYGMNNVNNIIFTSLTAEDCVDYCEQTQITSESGDGEKETEGEEGGEEKEGEKGEEPEIPEIDENNKISAKFTVYLKGGKREEIR